MIEADCHCGAVRIRVRALPDYVIDCNCSICRKNGALWALYPSRSIEIVAEPSSLTEYVWGPATIRTMFCRTCGSTTHWLPLTMPSDGNGDVNACLFDSSLVQGLKVRRFEPSGQRRARVKHDMSLVPPEPKEPPSRALYLTPTQWW